MYIGEKSNAHRAMVITARPQPGVVR
jgi:hypothetical protein